MPRTIKKVVHEPMWSEKALGVNVSDAAPSTLVHITCDYKRKSTNTLYFPDTYIMSVGQIKKYPSRKIKGARIHMIPFSDLEQSLKETHHEDYKPQNTEGEDLNTADNWKAAGQIEFFRQAYVDPLHKAVQKGWEYITTDKYEKECKLKGKAPDPDEKARINTRYEELKILLFSLLQ